MRLIEKKKQDLEDKRAQKYRLEQEIEELGKEIEAIKKIERFLKEHPDLKNYVTVNEVASQ